MILATASTKGGTGKTAVTGAICYAAVKDGQRCLVVDLDTQANLSLWLDADTSGKGSFDLISRGDLTAMQHRHGIDIFSGGAKISTLSSGRGSMTWLWDALEVLRDKYDLILIDTMPTITEGLYDAIYAADRVLFVLEAEPSSLQAFYQTMDIYEHIKRLKRGRVDIAGMVVNRYDNRPKINQVYLDTLKDAASLKCVPFVLTIRQGIAVREAMALQRSLFEYAPRAKVTDDVRAVYERIKQTSDEVTEERRKKK